ncbi:sensor histidine kinase [Rhizobium straminoryzae]|uniref:C4-dicarboxylate transport sensor protein n=2 Tax=Rhizobium straminoryzae TaxID=1387186 RepID=A0A549TB31_9HYPH|nr:sensor histidine kinase [Rhizobium straminoryzae]
MTIGLESAGERRGMAQGLRSPWFLFALCACLLLGLTLFLSRHYATRSVLADLTQQGRVDAGLKVALLRAVMERPRSLPLILARDRDVTEALRDPEAGRLDALNRKLEDLVVGTNASVLYVLDRHGVAVASSNWRDPTSFVGSDYGFRAYFSRAIAEGRAEHFAMGSVSRRPGLYISNRVGPAGNPLGVVVVKAEFDQLENDWISAARPSFVTDRQQVVLITSIPSWRFMTLGPLAPAVRDGIRASLQFGEAPLVPLPTIPMEQLSPDARLMDVLLPGRGLERYIELVLPVPSTEWQLHYLVPVEQALASGLRQAEFAALLGFIPLLALVAFWIWRRQTTLARIAAGQAARLELERRVAERTLDLTRARDRLEAEIADHKTTEARLQGVQQQLVQANRLAILGQVAAGVAHEINQPVATIRAYADNARTFLERRQTAPADDNLREIAGLTERIGAITDNLKALARRGRAAAGPVALQDVISGAVMLLKSRFAGRMEALAITLPSPDIAVVGSRLRLEQVMINLLQNALEAIGTQPDGQVRVSAVADDETVRLLVEDNGPGIPPDILEQLFTPFNSSKEAGLGLGLVIAKDIVSDYAGQITVESTAGATRFTVELKRARP